MKFFYVSAPAGSGKTQAIVDFSSNRALDGQKTLIIQPTKVLLDSTTDRLRRGNTCVRVRSIHSDKVLGATGEIARHIAKADTDGEVLLICQQAFDQLQEISRSDEWDVIFDEELSLDTLHMLNIPKSHPIITRYLCAEEVTDRYSRLKVDDWAGVKAIASNKSKDEVWSKLQTFARYLCSEDWDTYVLTESFRKLLAHENERLFAYSVRKPSSLKRYKSVRFASALFEQTLIYQAWKAQGAVFVEDQELKERLSYSEHQNGHLLTVKWALPGGWSKYRRDQADIEQAVVEAMRRELAGQSFLWLHNKDKADTPPFLGMEGARELPHVPHGLNDFSDYHSVAILAAKHLTPDRRKFHQEMWQLTPSQIGAATHLLSVYQAVMRSSLRVSENLEPKTILLPDYETAKPLLDIFPGSKAVQLDVELESSEVSKKRGRPRIHKDNAERVRAWRRKNQAKDQSQDTFHMLVPRT